MMQFNNQKWDEIQVKDLLLRTIIGFNPEERIKKQDVLINLILYTDLRPAGYTDEVSDAVNYKTITKRIITMVEASRFKLVERLAAEIAALCLADKRVVAARVRLEKPGALRFARSVGVDMFRSRDDAKMEPNRVFITVGSNIEPGINIRNGLEWLSTKCELISVSPVYQTQPVGKQDQPDFLNAAAALMTPFSALELKQDILRHIEMKLNRVRVDDKNAPRTLDLDIALFNYEHFDFDNHHIPDPNILKYAHLAVPLADIAPYYVHPETHQSLKEIAESLSTQGVRLREDIDLTDLIQ
jgi:dihydroneopterin aldolase/2-amino-4-hydroxy-6-hydroxymethyldihydropteridine diphosphokinase